MELCRPCPRLRHISGPSPTRTWDSALRTVDASQTPPASKHCLKFLVLTAAGSGEASGATWDETDIDGATWTIPGLRMKAGTEHRVPLSAETLDVLMLAHEREDGSRAVLPIPAAVRAGC